eukprot:3302914-Ditylum_brightwellii.AAC.1
MILAEKRVTTETPYDWPPQGPLSNKCWKELANAVNDTFDVKHNHQLPSKSRLGKWLNPMHSTGWKFSPAEDGLYESINVEWLDYLLPLEEEAGTHIDDTTEKELMAHHQKILSLLCALEVRAE